MPQTPGLISGTVRDAAGRPIAEARVYFASGPGSFPDIAALTDVRGTFSLAAPSPGSYEVECATEGYRTTRIGVTVAGGQSVRVDFTLPPACRSE
jgi:hypothetical protein